MPPQAEEWTKNKTLYRCIHDDADIGFIKRLYCNDCSTKEKRRAIHEENATVNKIPVIYCESCL